MIALRPFFIHFIHIITIYCLISNILFNLISNQKVIINTEIRSIPVTKKGIYFAFRDQGACLSIIAIKIFYITCPNITTNFATYPETPTGKELTTIVSADGQCVPNAQQVDRPRLLCKGDGNWTLPSGGCKCMAGYEPIGQTCQGLHPILSF
jgi:ephrin-B